MNIYDNYNIDTIRNVHSLISAILIGIFYLLQCITDRSIDRSSRLLIWSRNKTRTVGPVFSLSQAKPNQLSEH